MTVRVSQLNGCAFRIDINAATLMARGVAPAKVETLSTWRASDLFDERERVALGNAD